LGWVFLFFIPVLWQGEIAQSSTFFLENYGMAVIGMPKGFDLKRTSTLGLPLVDILTNQLGGKFEFRGGDQGVEFKLAFENLGHSWKSDIHPQDGR